jgi:predicted flavoprotein YhiN
MLFTHFGISGPIILTLSGRLGDWLKEGQVEISLNLKPALTDKQLDERLQREFRTYHLKGLQDILKFLLPGKMIPIFLSLMRIPGDKKGNQVTDQRATPAEKSFNRFPPDRNLDPPLGRGDYYRRRCVSQRGKSENNGI